MHNSQLDGDMSGTRLMRPPKIAPVFVDQQQDMAESVSELTICQQLRKIRRYYLLRR